MWKNFPRALVDLKNGTFGMLLQIVYQEWEGHSGKRIFRKIKEGDWSCQG
jgi:GH24 family phage-related lysozyme (muramidase)